MQLGQKVSEFKKKLKKGQKVSVSSFRDDRVGTVAAG
jgi:hypothetical protein